MIRLFIITTLIVLVSWTDASAKILNIQELKTEKGITFWLVEDHTLPILALNFALKSGASKDHPSKQGLTQLLSNTMDEGAGPYDAKAFQKTLEDHAIDLSFTSARDYFGGQLRTLNRHRDKALELLTYSLNEPRFDDEAVERMKNANITRIKKSFSKPNWVAARILNDLMFPDHPYALNSGGTVQTIEKLTPADLKTVKATHFSKDKLYVSLTGDVTPDDARALVDQVFGALPIVQDSYVITDSVLPEGEKPRYYAMDVPQTYLSMAWQGIGVNDSDYYAFNVMNHIFGGGGFSSILMDEVRDQRGLTYGIYSSRYHLNYAQRLLVNASMLPENVSLSLSLIANITKRMMNGDIDEDALQVAKDYLTGSLPISLSSTSKISGTMLNLQLDDRSIDALDKYSEEIKAVTRADIQRVARRVFSKAPVIVLVGAKPSDVELDVINVIPNADGSTQ